MAKPKLKRVTRKRRERKLVERGAAHIRSSFNNTIVTITDLNGNALSWASAGGLGFPRQQEVHAVRRAVGRRDRRHPCQGVWPQDRRGLCQGPRLRARAAIRALQAAGLEVNMIKDVTPIPHNGCRPPKRRRV